VASSIKRKRKYLPFFHSSRSEPKGAQHIADRFIGVASAVIDSLPPASLSLEIPPLSQAVATAFLQSHQIQSFVLINLSAGKDYREWRSESYIELLERLLKTYPALHFLLVMMPDRHHDAERIVQTLASPRVVMHSPTPDIFTIIALMEKSVMVFTPDTAILHIASALQRSVLGLYTVMNTHPQQWFPYRTMHRAVLTDGNVPVSTIEPERVGDAFDDLYAEIV
jgi:ADP-heptose:LPS heptosyltransferase